MALLNTRSTLAAAALTGMIAAPVANAHDVDLKEIAVGILTEGIAKGDRAFIERHVAEDYIQHNPQVADGRAGMLAMVDFLQAQGIQPRINPVRVLRDGDLVAIHSDMVVGNEIVVFDVFRFEDGVAVQHWDGIQPKPDMTVSGRSMTDGPTEITDRDQTEANRTLVVNLVTDVLMNGRFDRIPDYIGETYMQHNPQVGDGIEGMQAFVAYLQESDISFSFDTIHNVVAEGNFVLTQSEGSFGGAPTAFYDLFRVEDGRVVEHWDVIQQIPAEMAHDNGMF